MPTRKRPDSPMPRRCHLQARRAKGSRTPVAPPYARPSLQRAAAALQRRPVCLPPFVVAARTLNSADAGKEARTLPFVVTSSTSPFHLAFPMAIVKPPFVVRAETHSLVATSTLLLVVAASTMLFRSRQRIP